jgi:hypothetical protein
MAVARDYLAQGVRYEDVADNPALMDVEDLEEPPTPEPEPEQQTALLPLHLLQSCARPYADQAEQLRQERDDLQAKLDEANERIARLESRVGEMTGQLLEKEASRWDPVGGLYSLRPSTGL